MTESEYRELCGLMRELDLAVMMVREAGPDVADPEAGKGFYAALQRLRTFVANFEREYPATYAAAYLTCEHAPTQAH